MLSFAQARKGLHPWIPPPFEKAKTLFSKNPSQKYRKLGYPIDEYGVPHCIHALFRHAPVMFSR